MTIQRGNKNNTIKHINYSNLETFANKIKEDYAKKTQVETVETKVQAVEKSLENIYNKQEIDSKISSVYKPAGSLEFASLPSPTADILGNVYNVIDAFTTNASFIEGSGKMYPAGTNVVVVKQGTAPTLRAIVDENIIDTFTTDGVTYKYDVLAGFVDLSGYVKNETDKGLSTNDFTNVYKTKLDGIAANSTKVEASTNNGKVKINGVETTVYTLPSSVLHEDDFEEVTEAEILALLAD